MHLYVREQPERTLVLTTSSDDERRGCPRRAMIFRASGPKVSSQATVEFVPKEQVEFGDLIRLSARQIQGCLGLINIEHEIFLAVVTISTPIGNLRPGAEQAEEVHRIQEVAFYGLNTSRYDDLGAVEGSLPSPIHTADSIMRDSPYYSSQTPPPTYDHPASAIMSLFTSGTFYYAPAPVWDISSRLSERIQKNREVGDSFASYDERFVWNEFVVKSLLGFRERLDAAEKADFDKCQFIILAIQGYVGLYTVNLPKRPSDPGPMIATVGIISRLGWKRAGTRFNTRGVDDDGNVANFVESETIFVTDATCMSYVQVRGSVPLFWEQQGLQTFRPTVQITRSQAASQPAFDRHFADLADHYGAVHALNLLGTRENEATLTDAYSSHLKALQSTGGIDIGITHYDFHHHVKLTGHDSVIEIRRIPSVRSSREKFGGTTVDMSTDSIITAQHGVFRTNCLDCLDRTNFVQDILSRTALEDYFMQVRPEWRQSTALWGYHRELWAENGDALSRIYAGTGALNTSFTRTGKRTLIGALADATKSVSRAYINNFQDKAKQIAIDLFLGTLAQQKPVTIFDPIHDTVKRALFDRQVKSTDPLLHEYSTTKHISIFVGTWNLNGRPSSESLLPWLFPRPGEPDIFAIGFQEIVPLTAQQILQTDPEQKRRWEYILMETLARRPNKKADYTILRSEQLVGTALIIIVKSDITGNIRRVEAATRKTGLRGISGNKGAVAIRLEYHDTSFCFVTAHLAAGHTNVEERNSDYRTIVSGLHFLKGRTIGNHDNVIWLADTNYRIDLENDVVRAMAENDELDMLLAADQLGAAISSGAAFVGYEEGPILFRPTYRYNLNSDEYDTSEKMRIPAWTDRILHRGNQLDLEKYFRAELKSSDHRPVYALFRAEVRIVDQAKRSVLQKSLLQQITSTSSSEKLDEKLAPLRNTAPDISTLPPPSSGALDDWWNAPEHPNGVFDISAHILDDNTRIKPNPFESPDISHPSSLHSSPSTSDDELYKHAVSASKSNLRSSTSVKKPPPTPNRATKPSATSNGATDSKETT
ncbi:DNase I-like protein [Serendipita vermifera]|nr:DNase I-like protein [Serendipita vermifera]